MVGAAKLFCNPELVCGRWFNRELELVVVDGFQAGVVEGVLNVDAGLCGVNRAVWFAVAAGLWTVLFLACMDPKFAFGVVAVVVPAPDPDPFRINGWPVRGLVEPTALPASTPGRLPNCCGRWDRRLALDTVGAEPGATAGVAGFSAPLAEPVWAFSPGCAPGRLLRVGAFRASAGLFWRAAAPGTIEVVDDGVTIPGAGPLTFRLGRLLN